MGNETTALKRSPNGRRAGATGRQIVGNYTDQRAGDAAQAVRRAGLRPGLERSFGCDPSLLGLVVYQEPQAGSALARNGMVTLHVAAPGNEGATEGITPVAPVEPTPRPAERTPASEPTSASVDVERDREPRDAASLARRRRKPGLTKRAQLDCETPPAPLLPAPPKEVREDNKKWSESVEPDPAVQLDGLEFSEETSEEDVFDGLTQEEFVVHVDEVFAGYTDRWRPAQPIRRAHEAGQGIRERLAAHPWLTGSAAIAIGLWVLLGVLASQHRAHPLPASSRLTARAPITQTVPVRRTPLGHPAQRRHEITQPTIAQRTVLPRPHAHMPVRRASAVRPVMAAPATSAPVQPAPAAPGVRASEPAAPPAAEQRSGGQFSP